MSDRPPTDAELLISAVENLTELVVDSLVDIAKHLDRIASSMERNFGDVLEAKEL